jgi:hypothetical protein
MGGNPVKQGLQTIHSEYWAVWGNYPCFWEKINVGGKRKALICLR